MKYLSSKGISVRSRILARINLIPFDDYSLVILDACDRSTTPKDFLYQIRLLSDVPVFILTESPSETFRASCYDAGADGLFDRSDDPQLVLSMIQAFLRRFPPAVEPMSHTSSPLGLRPVPNERSVMVGEVPVSLSQAEFDTLLFLLNNPNRVVTRSEFLEHAGIFGHSTTNNTLNIQVARIRKKCGFSKNHPIETIRGVGYRLNVITSQQA